MWRIRRIRRARDWAVRFEDHSSMREESMTSDERLWAAIRLEKPDRVPVIPSLLPEPAARLAGLTQERIARDNRAAVDAVFEVFDAHGGWDNPYPAGATPLQLQASGIYPMKLRLPGEHLSSDDVFQLDEQEILRPQDYHTLSEIGLDRFYREDYLWRVAEIGPDELPGTLEDLATGFGRFLAECSKRDTRPFFLAHGFHPFFTLSLMRSMVPFTRDLYDDPEPVERALRRLTDDLIPSRITMVKQSGVDLCMLTEERASAYFYPPAIFERFWWPYTREIVEAFWSEGIITLFHLDQCWDRNLPYFKDLPRGSAILELDSTTDIFAAKDALRDHLCLRGDVSASLLSIGDPRDVSTYCKRLIDEVGGDGGFILGSGCSVPSTVRAENFRSMIETGKHYELSRA